MEQLFWKQRILKLKYTKKYTKKYNKKHRNRNKQTKKEKAKQGVERLDNTSNLDIPKILKTFGTQDGIFKAKYSQEFLKAIGIEMDQESMEIQNIMSKPRFSSTYGIDRIFNIIQIVNRFAVSGTEEQKLAAEEFARIKGWEYMIVTEDFFKSRFVNEITN